MEKVVQSAWLTLKHIAPDLYESVRRRISQVTTKAAKIDVPLGVVDYGSASILGLGDEWVELESLYAQWADLSYTAAKMINCQLMGPVHSHDIPEVRRWKDQEAVDQVPGFEEAPGVWLSWASKASESMVPGLEESLALDRQQRILEAQESWSEQLGLGPNRQQMDQQASHIYGEHNGLHEAFEEAKAQVQARIEMNKSSRQRITQG